MPLQSSGPITMSDIAGEFGGSAPYSLSSYYRGGGLVPNITENNSIPTSGAISMSNFYNTYGAPTGYDVGAGSYEDLNPFGGGANLVVLFNTNGVLQIAGAVFGMLYEGTWVTPQGFAPGSYHIRADIQFGSFSSGITGTDLPLTSSVGWTKFLNSAGDETVQALFTLKDGFGGNTLTSGVISLRVGSV